jgi:methyl-accepting chemotaxis protein
VLGDQVESVSAFVSEMGSVIGDQSDLTERIYSISEEVIEAAMSVAQVSRQSKMLSMNTMIEAARLGEQGRSFVVIAEEMRRLSENIAESNARIADLSRDLAPILESARANIEDLRSKADDFSASSDQHQTEISCVVDALANSTQRTLEAGDRRLADIIRISNAALVDLQFEDPVAQRLRKLAAGFGDGTHDAPGFVSEQLEASEGGLAAGEIELF